MSEHPNARLIREFGARQRAMYAGGPIEPVAELLADDVVWHVPGASGIAGDHRGREEVLAYFARRRDLAGNTLAITVRDAMVDDEAVVQLADGRARIAGAEATWRTVGVYRITAGRIAEAWLVPLDLSAFDAIWAPLPRGERP